MWCHWLQHQAACCNLRALAHTNVAQDGRTCPDEHVVADLWVAISMVLACAAKGHILHAQEEQQQQQQQQQHGFLYFTHGHPFSQMLLCRACTIATVTTAVLRC
jgi:hypothetical protein